ncbi:hypothetical protein BJA5080_05344 [Bradyrhizobium diazoefficiens SEMIA 5080]|uniref:Uncharacterized protein n=1 Tax=Bradyrhizobium diazoefficiens SEMIA 5080 TaxID=754504 RepID=A0A837C2M3_9BRAD|nr:hypothetical protein BJA5080_05344 [Bradyrhizobium diazoefficiens SEMIA 5080]
MGNQSWFGPIRLQVPCAFTPFEPGARWVADARLAYVRYTDVSSRPDKSEPVAPLSNDDLATGIQPGSMLLATNSSSQASLFGER